VEKSGEDIKPAKTFGNQHFKQEMNIKLQSSSDSKFKVLKPTQMVRAQL
jgi:hypothetical protein